MSKDNKTSDKHENEQPCALHSISGSLLSFEFIMNESKRVKENIKSEPDGIVRKTMIDNLLVGLQ